MIQGVIKSPVGYAGKLTYMAEETADEEPDPIPKESIIY